MSVVNTKKNSFQTEPIQQLTTVKYKSCNHTDNDLSSATKYLYIVATGTPVASWIFLKLSPSPRNRRSSTMTLSDKAGRPSA